MVQDLEISTALVDTQLNRIQSAIERARAPHADDMFPYYQLVPKDLMGNMLFRKAMVLGAAADRGVQHALIQMCALDLLFYINVFCWTVDPRDRVMPRRPFITWRVQDAAIAILRRSLGVEDVLSEKSRDMGATLIFLMGIEHSWHFYGMQNFGLISRNADYVDCRGKHKPLFQKIDFLHENQPGWLLPSGRELGEKDPNRKLMHIKNADNGSTIDGESTTGDCFRGDRLTAIMLDEFAAFDIRDGYNAEDATRDATNCRLINSTPRGMGNAFYDMTQTVATRIRIHWSEHPVKRLGLYKGHGGALRILDTHFWRKRLREAGGDEFTENLEGAVQESYPFVLDDEEFQVRSPWFDEYCKRANSRASIRQEAEIKYDASTAPFFSPIALIHQRKNYARPCAHRGQLKFDLKTCLPDIFQSNSAGPVELWFKLDATGAPPVDADYVMGVDIATGVKDNSGRGTSNSVIAIGNRRINEKVAQYTANGVLPHDLARIAIALGRWFRCFDGSEAHIIWEQNGPGRIFGQGVVELGYSDFYLATNESSMNKKVSTIPGWHTSRESKKLLFGEFRRALVECDYVERSLETLKECDAFQHGPNETIMHVSSLSTKDASGARENHGDRVTATALMWWRMRGKRIKRPQDMDVPAMCAQRRINDAAMLKKDDNAEDWLWN